MNVIQDESTVGYLIYLVRTYDGLTRLLAGTKNRIQHVNPDANLKDDDVVQAMESLKGKVGRKINKHLQYWKLWTHWLQDVPGIGPAYAGRLILLHYYRSVPVCEKCNGALEKIEGGMKCRDCGQDAKGKGVLKYRVELKNFPKVSSWWHYMGLHVVNGKKPKRTRGQVADWSTPGRTLSHLIASQFVKTPGKYRDFYDLRRAKREQTHPDATKFHKHNMACNETAKLFMSHLWHVAKVLGGETPTRPYAHTVMGHTNFVEPFYFEPMTA